jgi:hypothetical protein
MPGNRIHGSSQILLNCYPLMVDTIQDLYFEIVGERPTKSFHYLNKRRIYKGGDEI